MADKKGGDLAPEDEGARAFGKLLAELEDGQFHGDLSREVVKLMANMRDVSSVRGISKGEITITLKFKSDEYDVVTTTSTFKVKPPTQPRRATTLWMTPGGNLTNANPKQVELPLRAVPPPREAEIKALADAQRKDL